MKSTLPFLGFLALAISGTVAASDDVYSPTGATQWNDRYRAIVIATEQGTVELASFGIAELTPREATTMRTLHVRMAVTNKGAPAPWSIDVATARLEINGKSERPLFVNSDIATLPIAIIDRGERCVLDFYFEAPPDIASEPDLAAFGFQWQINTPGRMLASRTRFARQEPGLQPSTDILLPAGWGGQWWYDPMHSWPLYRHHDGPITHRPPDSVAITRVPRLHRR